MTKVKCYVSVQVTYLLDKGVLLRSSSNDEGPSRVWMALLEQQAHPPPSSTGTNIHKTNIDVI